MEDLKLTVQLSSQGFVVVSSKANDSIDVPITSEDDQDALTYFETPYALLDSVSPGYRDAFGQKLTSQLLKISQKDNQE